MKTQVVRSARRTKTVQARMVDGTLRVAIPDRFSAEEEAHWVGVMTRKFDQRQRTGKVDLAARAAALAVTHDLPRPREIVWSSRQTTRWGSCSPASGRVRIASQLGDYPRWVLDYVIVHELAHLVEPSHSSRFWEVVGRYPLTERARGYLIAKGAEPDPTSHENGSP